MRRERGQVLVHQEEAFCSATSPVLCHKIIVAAHRSGDASDYRQGFDKVHGAEYHQR